MGCCGSTEAVRAPGQVDAPGADPSGPKQHIKAQGARVDDVMPELLQKEQVEDIKSEMMAAETEAVSWKPEHETFLGSVLAARSQCPGDAAVMEDACIRMQAYNRHVKNTIATLDAMTIHEAMHGGFLGLGCNDRKLITALCTRTKAQLERTCTKYWALYDTDMSKDVTSETGGKYGRMMACAMSSGADYVADMIDRACKGLGCDETLLVELYCTRSNAELRAGKAAWEGRTDKSLVDYLNSELSGLLGHPHLLRLLRKLLKGDRDEGLTPEQGLAKEQAAFIHGECTKGIFDGPKVNQLVDTIGDNSREQNQLLADVYERTYDVSLGKHLDKKCEAKLHLALKALLLPTPDFIAWRLERAMKGWLTDSSTLIVLLGGIDGLAIDSVAVAYERKYSRPLEKALRDELSGSSDFERAAVAWARAMQDPSGGLEGETEQEVGKIAADAGALGRMADALLLEHESLLRFISTLDTERLADACRGWGTDDTELIQCLTTRSKRYLTRVSMLYRQLHGHNLEQLVDKEITGGGRAARAYANLAKYLVLPEVQSDVRLLNLAMDPSQQHAGQKENLRDEKLDLDALIEFLCARHPRRVRAAKRKWEGKHDASLVDKLGDELQGDMRKLALVLLKGRRSLDEEALAPSEAYKQAKRLKDEGKPAFIELLAFNSIAQNGAVARAYEETYDESLSRAIGNAFEGPAVDALRALLQGRFEFYAARLKVALHGGDHSAIARILGSHDREDVRGIAEAYFRKYDVVLKDVLTDKIIGDYKRLAVAWVDLFDQLEQPRKHVLLPRGEEDDDDEAPPDRASYLDPMPPPEPEPEQKEEDAEDGGFLGELSKKFTGAAQQLGLAPAPLQTVTPTMGAPVGGPVVGAPAAPTVQGDFNGDGIPDHLQPKAILRVVAPPNCWAGQTIHVRSDDGQMLPMTLPAGVHAGQALHVEYTPKQLQRPKQELRVTVPPGAYAGMQVHVRAPSGQMMTVAIPQGLHPGSTFLVKYEAQAQAQANLSAPPPVYGMGAAQYGSTPYGQTPYQQTQFQHQQYRQQHGGGGGMAMAGGAGLMAGAAAGLALGIMLD